MAPISVGSYHLFWQVKFRLLQLRLVHKLQPPLVQVIASGVFQDDVQGMLRRLGSGAKDAMLGKWPLNNAWETASRVFLVEVQY